MIFWRIPMIYNYKNSSPDTEKALFIARSADIAGDVRLAEGTSIWFNASIRGDLAPVIIGEKTNIQDNAVVHVAHDLPADIGAGVTIGHSAIIHACRIEDDCLIGMGAIILDGAVIGKESIVGAGALVTGGKEFPPRSLIVGSPARAVRSLSDDDVAAIRANGEEYVELAKEYQQK
jgi:carbonic anhydrase/acetyltransferase-like protein (isoleucine patch superfamily)